MAGKPEVKAELSGLRCSPGLAVSLTPGPLPRHGQPYPWGPPPARHQGAGERHSGSSAGPSAGAGMWGRRSSSRTRAWCRTFFSYGQSPALAPGAKIQPSPAHAPGHGSAGRARCPAAHKPEPGRTGLRPRLIPFFFWFFVKKDRNCYKLQIRFDAVKRTSSYMPASDTTAIIRLYRFASLKNQVYYEAADI